MWSTWYARNEKSPYADLDHNAVQRGYYEVISETGRKVIETVSLEEAQLFVRKLFNRGEGVATITEVVYEQIAGAFARRLTPA